jgi:alanyl-tRNA synthetase
VRAQPLIEKTAEAGRNPLQAHARPRPAPARRGDGNALARAACCPGDVAFKLYDTFGFPLDLTQDVGEMLSGGAKAGDLAELKIDRVRRAKIRANHSATHLLHAALRNQARQARDAEGLAGRGRLFPLRLLAHAPMTREEIEAVEAEVNASSARTPPARSSVMAPDKAIEAGAMALFGEKYGDEVRVFVSAIPCRSWRLTRSNSAAARMSRARAISRCSSSRPKAAWRKACAASRASRAAALAFLKGARRNIAARDRGPVQVAIAEAPARVAHAESEQRKKLEAELADARKKLAMGGGGAAVRPGRGQRRQVHRQGRRCAGEGSQRPR